MSASLVYSEMFWPQFYDARFWCHTWPSRVECFNRPFTTRTLEPILIIGNEDDPVTPFAAAKWVAGNLGSSAVLVEQDDYGHTLFAEHSDCTLAIISAFFTNGTYPQNGQTCGTDQPLFPAPCITKHLLEHGPSDPALDASYAVPATSRVAFSLLLRV
jgi:hypothetical protein